MQRVAHSTPSLCSTLPPHFKILPIWHTGAGSPKNCSYTWIDKQYQNPRPSQTHQPSRHVEHDGQSMIGGKTNEPNFFQFYRRSTLQLCVVRGFWSRGRPVVVVFGATAVVAVVDVVGSVVHLVFVGDIVQRELKSRKVVPKSRWGNTEYKTTQIQQIAGRVESENDNNQSERERGVRLLKGKYSKPRGSSKSGGRGSDRGSSRLTKTPAPGRSVSYMLHLRTNAEGVLTSE